ncbi:Thioesterase/thiol ester dehydrase-isomerase [Gigaspora margarita]|uniref:Thioesterase/thiol ester dehydrase-isomerase n=1 Tax=Gigaspora margarita TaxID=4874 RepID=A0A8H3X1G3_GIGMA|nr:Thioesterase/thiol ester dehydrase-isomerase [Gigaspora margarita]
METTTIAALIITSIAILIGTFTFLANKAKMLRNPLQAWNELNKPIIRHFHMRITSLEEGNCSGVLKEQKKIHNPFNCIHAAALCTFAETIGGLAVLTKLTKNHRAIVTKINMEVVFSNRIIFLSSCLIYL